MAFRRLAKPFASTSSSVWPALTSSSSLTNTLRTTPELGESNLNTAGGLQATAHTHRLIQFGSEGNNQRQAKQAGTDPDQG